MKFKLTLLNYLLLNLKSASPTLPSPLSALHLFVCKKSELRTGQTLFVPLDCEDQGSEAASPPAKVFILLSQQRLIENAGEDHQSIVTGLLCTGGNANQSQRMACAGWAGTIGLTCRGFKTRDGGHVDKHMSVKHKSARPAN